MGMRGRCGSGGVSGCSSSTGTTGSINENIDKVYLEQWHRIEQLLITINAFYQWIFH